MNIYPLNSPSPSAFIPTISDIIDLTYECRGLYVGISGDINLLLFDDIDPILIKNAQAGVMYPFKIKRIFSTNTTATNLICLK
jgi:hypothetical protein